MSAAQIVEELRGMGSGSIRKVLLNHGAPEPVLGVRIGDMKPIQKRIGMDYQLALDLFDTGIYDAMYLAGLIADDLKMSKKDLNHWLKTAGSGPACGCTVAWVAAESHHGHELAMEWIDAKDPGVAATGWATLSSLVSIKADAELDIPELKKLVQRVQKTIQKQPDALRKAMNGFVIAVGSYVRPLTDFAIETAEQIGEVEVDVGDTACKIPFAPDYIRKAVKRNPMGKKRATAKC